MKRNNLGMGGIALALAIGGGFGMGIGGGPSALPYPDRRTTIYTEVSTGRNRKRKSGNDRRRSHARANGWKPRDTFGKSVARNHRRGNR